MKFQPGERVVCINDDFSYVRHIPNGMVLPKRGTVYTVREYVGATRKGTPCLTVVEIVNRILNSNGVYGEASFSEARFERLRETSIGLLRQIAQGRPVGVGGEEFDNRRKTWERV